MTDREGRFAIAQLGTGAHQLVVQHADHVPILVQDLEVVGKGDLDLGLLRAERGVRLEGKVSFDGVPAPHALLLLSRVTPEIPSPIPWRFSAGEEGSFVAPHHLPAGRYELAAAPHACNPFLGAIAFRSSRTGFDVAPDGAMVRIDVTGSLAGR